jgi:tetratricopeptide (TPR) repeat protein
MSIENNWTYIDARNYSFVEICRAILSSVDRLSDQIAAPFDDEAAARAALQRTLSTSEGFTVVIDGTREAEKLAETIAPLLSNEKRIIIVPKAPSQFSTDRIFRVPELTADEVRDVVAGLRGTAPSEVEIVRLLASSGGNPLYLRFYALAPAPSEELSLRDLEVRACSVLNPRSREVVSYLALAPSPLSLSDLQALLGFSTANVAEVTDALEGCAPLVRQTRRRVEIVHDHLKGTIAEELKANSAALAFYSLRLGNYLEEDDEILDAFLVFDRAGEAHRLDALVDRAAYEASIRGAVGPALAIFSRQVQIARDNGNLEAEIKGLLSLAFVAQQAGDQARSKQALNDAKERAQDAPSEELRRTARDFELELLLRVAGDRSLLNKIIEIKDEYAEAGDQFNVARLALLLSAENVADGEPLKAAESAEEAFRLFTALGDAYGTRLAQFNVVSALSGIPSRREEAYDLARQLEKEVDPRAAPRERALICNILARRSRQLDDPQAAAGYAREAIDIGDALGDRRLVAVNRINLGNALRDQSLPREALVQYQLAEAEAHAVGQVRLEASAHEVIASVHNELGDYGLALAHAAHAIALTRDTTDRSTLARSYEERAIAFTATHNVLNAVTAYVDGAKAVETGSLEGAIFASLLTSALRLCVQNGLSVEMAEVLAKLFGRPGDPAVRSASPRAVLESVCTTAPRMLGRLTVEGTLPTIALIFSFVLRNVPPRIERAVVGRMAKVFTTGDRSDKPEPSLAALAGLLLASDWNHVETPDLVQIAESASRRVSGLHYKPYPDGGAHWTVALPITKHVTCTIDELDPRQNFGLTASVVALVFRAMVDGIEALLGTENLPRREFQVQITGESAFVENIDPERELLPNGALAHGFTLSESTDLSRTDQPPLFVICRDNFPGRWIPEDTPQSEVHVLIARILDGAVNHLFARRVDRETTRPKLVRLIQAFSLHP